VEPCRLERGVTGLDSTDHDMNRLATVHGYGGFDRCPPMTPTGALPGGR
jgi:hypothetical protein